MANSLLITKLSDDSFSFIVNGDVVNAIINLRNDMTNVGNECHFKTSEGANLIKLQQILYNEVTIVDGATLPVASSPIDLRLKLISVGFWDWLFIGGGSGVDRFDELDDTFLYYGNDGKIPMVDESQLKLIPYSLPDTSYLNLFPNPLVANKGLKTNALATAYEFYDIVNLVTQFIRPLYTETSPSEDVVYNALALKANITDLPDNDSKTDNSAGAIQGFAVTNNGNGTININEGTAFLRATNDQYAPLIKYTIPAVTNLSLTDNANNFVLVDYNGGSPALTVTTNSATINTETNSLAVAISRVGNNLDYISLVGQNNDANAKLRVRFLNQEGIRRANGATIGFSSRNLTLTSGTLFSGLIRINSPAFNTASPDTFTYVYNNGAVWTRVTGQTQVNNTQYNNSGTLTTMPTNDFRTDYVYLLPNNPSKLYLVYGNTTYNSITLARNAPTPTSLPSELQVLGLLVGRQIIQKNASAISEVSSAFADVFAGVGVPEHNSLAGLQGGEVNDYQHLTTAEKNKLNSVEYRNPIYYKGKDIEWFGDSYTQGTGATSTDLRFTSIVSRALGGNEINHGVAGTTMEKRTPIDYMASPNMVDNVVNIPTKTASKSMLVFAFGLNDMGQTAPAYTTANYKTDYQFVINNAISKGWLPNQILIIPAYYIGSAGYAAYATITGNAAPTQARHLSFIQAAKEISETNGTMYFDIYQDQVKNDITLLDADNIHPNNAGHAYIANDILQYLGADKVNVKNNSTYDLQAGFVQNLSKSNVLTNSLIYDSGTQIGIGTITPTAGLHANSISTLNSFKITNTTTGALSSDGFDITLTNNDVALMQHENSFMDFYTNNLFRNRITASGNSLFGTNTDDGVNKVQVSGTIGTNGLGIGTTTFNTKTPIHSHVTGTDYIYTQWTNGDTGQAFTDGCILGIGNNMDFNMYNMENRPINFATNATVRASIDGSGVLNVVNLAGTGNAIIQTDNLGNLSRGSIQPLRYKALISQTGTSAPTVTIIENTLGTVTYSYSSVGVYTANSSSLFTSGKTFLMMNGAYGNGNINAIKYNSSSVLDIRSSNGLTPTDGLITDVSILIEVYP